MGNAAEFRALQRERYHDLLVLKKLNPSGVTRLEEQISRVRTSMSKEDIVAVEEEIALLFSE